MSETLTRRAAVGAAALGALALATQTEAEAKDKPTAIAPLVEVLRAHDKAYAAHDLNGVLATMTPDVLVLGTSPAEIWMGKKEVGQAYEHFFKDFDKSGETFDPQFVEGGIDGTLGLFAATTQVKLTKDGKKSDFGMNLSVAFSNVGGKWLIRALHYSTLAPEPKKD